MKALLVIDVQTDVMRFRDTRGLIEVCNDRIIHYAPEKVMYVVHKMPWERASKKKKFGSGLLVVSDRVFDKRVGNAFSNSQLLQTLKDEQVDEVEIIGIDGNHCVKETAFGALKNGFKATVNERAVASMNKREFESTKQQLCDAGVAVISE